MIDFNQIQTMGVINMTPNSFSDGGQFNSAATFAQRFDQAGSDFDIVDLGAESTAPFNEKVAEDEELNRFKELFFPLLNQIPDNSMSISIDTYKVSVFTQVYDEIKNFWPNAQIIFNDVSGKIDEELLSLLDSKRSFSYVYSHNLAPSREETTNHMNFITKENITAHMKDYFQDGLKTLTNFDKKILLDPCFGFSKTREQNHKILSELGEVFSNFNDQYKILIGISRKSFLRFPRDLDLNKVENQKILDAEQALILQNIAQQLPKRPLVLRLHDLCSYSALKNTQRILNSFA